MIGKNLIRSSDEARCVAVDNGEGRRAMLALFSVDKADAFLAMTPEAARHLAHDLLLVADHADSDRTLPRMPVTRMVSA